MPRVGFVIRQREAQLIRRLARDKGVSQSAILKLAVWAYVLPLVPSLKAPVDLPERKPRRRR